MQEVECWGGNLETEVKVFSLTMFKGSDKTVLASVNHVSNECTAFGEFASCSISTPDTRKTVLRVLVLDLEEGESRAYGCNATYIKWAGHTATVSWSIFVTRNSECSLCIRACDDVLLFFTGYTSICVLKLV